MEQMIMGTAMFLGVLVPGIILCVCLFYGRTDAYSDGLARRHGGRRIFLLTDSPRPFVPAIYPSWFLELADTADGSRKRKNFRGQLVLGRDMGVQDGSGMLSLSPDCTVSRRQCRLISGDDRLFVENLSGVNATRLNGYAVDGMQELDVGDFLTAGRKHYVVTDLRRTG